MNFMIHVSTDYIWIQVAYIKHLYKLLIILYTPAKREGQSWSWSYGSWIYNYLCNQCLSPLKLSVWIPLMVRCTRYNVMWFKVCRWLATGQWFSPGTPVSFTNKTDRHNITEILLKVALNTIKQTNIYLCLKEWQ
jgi:hypothetical protein